jgi:YVTN family beta-propeller protein
MYVGAAACRQCHNQVEGRNQFNKWYLSRHARAFASLAHPASEQIARLSGIDEDVFQSPICLGCHTTGAAAESWEREAHFFSQDGVQCERCHGPGSEYMREEIMADREAAMQAGLKIPAEDTCMVCHESKGSHQSLLEVKKFDFHQARQTIDHSGRGGPLGAIGDKRGPRADGPKYVGVMTCGRCHQGKRMGHPFSKWRLSAHAQAYAVLGTVEARQVAQSMGVSGDPQSSVDCLQCHATGQSEPSRGRTATFEVFRGVQCESCHGPGSEYASEPAMGDAAAAHGAGLQVVNRETCTRCHRGYHGKRFDYRQMLAAIAHPKPEGVVEQAGGSEYKTPFNLAISGGGERLFVACEASDSLVVVDTRSRAVLAEVEVQNLPHGVCLSADETRVFVSNRGSDTVSEIDARTYGVQRTIRVGDEPHGLITDPAGDHLYVANAGSNDISVVDLHSGLEVKRLAGGRGTWSMKLSPDARFIYVTNNLSHLVPFRTPSISEVTVIDTHRAQVADRIMIPEANLVQGVAFAPGGEFALVTLLRTKHLVPIVRVIQGWMITNGIGILWPDGRVDQLLLDEFDDYFADPTDVVITPDGKYAYVSGGGINAVAVVDLSRMMEVLHNAGERERRLVLPNHLGIPSNYVVKRIQVGHGPRGLLASPQGDFVYVADALSDTISVIDVAQQQRVATIDLGGPEELTPERLGERVFHSAEITYGRQFSCHSCHPDGGIDMLTYDIEPDGLGVNPVDNRTLKGILDTAPFKWTGKNPSLRRQCGPRLAVFFTRIDPFTPEQVENLESYIRTIPRNPNRYRIQGLLTPAQGRGKKLFQRIHTNSGELIAYGNRCDTCHPGPYFTNRQKVDVGTQSWLDTQGTFDVPHLNNIYETAPYLHDGQAETLEEIWTRFNPEDKHGVTNDMTKDQLNDLIEYLKTL